MRIGCGTGSNPTRVPCCRNFRISLSSVNPLLQLIKENDIVKYKKSCYLTEFSRAGFYERRYVKNSQYEIDDRINQNAHSLIDADLLDLWNKDLKQSHNGLQRELAFPLIYPVAGRHPLINVINIVGTRLLGYANATFLHIK